MALVADANGVVKGKFTIPGLVPAGSKEVLFNGVHGSRASATFFGEGTLVENVMERVTTTTFRYIDPLAQTFFLEEMRQVVGVELYVEKKGPTPITVHIRSTENGYPGETVLAEAVLRPNQITVSAWNRWLFEMPITLSDNIEYCVVVMCNDPDAEIGIAELGKWGLESNWWVTSQPNNVGVLFSSSNNRAWTAHQDKDMAFRVLAAKYTENRREIDLGNVVSNMHTDVMMLAPVEVPSSDTGFQIDASTPNGVIEAGNGQVLQMRPAFADNIGIKAVLTATPNLSALLFPGTQIVLGTLQSNADYISRAFDADAAGSNIRVTFDALLPSGSAVKIYLSDDSPTPVFEEIHQDLERPPVPVGDGWFEFSYDKKLFNKARCRIKIELSGSNTARPLVSNLRCSVTGV